MLEDRRFPKLHLNFQLRLNKFQYLRPELNIPSLLLTTCLFLRVIVVGLLKRVMLLHLNQLMLLFWLVLINRKDPPTENVPEGKKPRIA
ncbi:unnamed protein product [Brassica rapa]|uniref:Uncharacterized protein n=1 Tax=Brassica campestris TaxID=3711 RepID=A0A3P5ZPY4_BRACM|nr:unnamed protein product [Brassica rapa]CAG7893981.1 unnamed protein product [Brassica rapa]VDC76643.1 unnamed protein product [Brassica rapa]VDC89504.1 unnamed protein product [Brassica rapa]